MQRRPGKTAKHKIPNNYRRLFCSHRFKLGSVERLGFAMQGSSHCMLQGPNNYTQLANRDGV